MSAASGCGTPPPIVMARAGQLEATRECNDAVLALGPASDGFLVPVVPAHPADADAALAEVDRAAGLGARMLKLHPDTQGLTWPTPGRRGARPRRRARHGHPVRRLQPARP